MRRVIQSLLLLMCLGLLVTQARSAEWKKHVVHTGVHSTNAVAADFTGDKKVDITARPISLAQR